MNDTSAILMGAILYLGLLVLTIATMWKINTKANKPGWACIVPIYNIIVMLEIAKKPTWWIFLMIIPFVNFIIMILIALSLAKNFGKSEGFAVGLILLPFIFYPILAFGDAVYVGDGNGKQASDLLDQF